MPLPFDVTPEMRIFSGQHLLRLERAWVGKQRFAYYTSAATAAEILRREELWLRLPSVMNDFSETEHGLSLLATSLRSGQGRLVVATLNSTFPGLGDELFDYVLGPDPRRIFADTFIACVSEHLPKENRNGRLSMWRAYGGVSGVALVFSIDVFATDESSGIYSSAVEYADYAEFDRLIGELAVRLEAGRNHLTSMGRELVRTWILETAQLAALNVKHPAFDEEREWRLFRTPEYPLEQSLRREVVTIDGVPQPILKFHLPGLVNHIERVIIGPTEFPLAVGSAIIQCLAEKGVPNPGERVISSGVPLRPQRR